VSRYRQIRALLAAAVVVVAAVVWATGHIEGSADDHSTHALAAGQQMLIAMLDQETGLRGYSITGDTEFLQPFRRGRAAFETALTDARRYASDGRDKQLIARQDQLAHRWEDMADPELVAIAAGKQTSLKGARGRKAIMDGFRAANLAFTADKQADRTRDRATAQELAVAIVAGVGLLFAVLGWLAFERPARRDAARRRRLAEFGDALQVARSEHEAFNVLRRHLEGWLDHARAVVLIRNSSANRLQAATSVDSTPRLAERLEGAAPETCLSVRLAKPYVRKPGSSGLLVCEICGELPGNSSCVPTIVGGEVIGSVLVQTPAAIAPEEQDDLATSISTAGPVIANLRNLAIAEMRAATDMLTGLANHRSVQDTLNRMVAQAGRSKTQLAAILFDLDHFKKVNDIHGHAKGDEVLASVGAAVAATARESDFVGRYGGEEFVALLPDTDVDGAASLAEKLRIVIEALEIPDLDRRLSASFGVAVLPGNAATGEQLLRAADRALYAAKNAGRNRVEVVRSGESRAEAPQRG
jgi:diguanylate cyclase (GGDEF)-like protein